MGKDLTAKRLEALWAGLGDADAVRAFRAVTQLTRSPEQALPLLSERSKPPAAATLRLVKGKGPGGADWLRAHRLVEVLLRLRTAQARKLLERWAEDGASWLGSESRAALAIFPARKAE